jgi:hypothetical protein
MSLGAMPNRGRIGRIAGTRELVSAPFIIVYRIEAEIVEILRIYHSAQDCGPSLYSVAPLPIGATHQYSALICTQNAGDMHKGVTGPWRNRPPVIVCRI